MPPGTGDIHLTLSQSIPLTGVVIVSTPQEVALIDAKKAIVMYDGEQIKVPLLGIIENMAYFTPEELPENKYYIFGREGGRRLSEQFEIPFIGEVPIVMSIREGGDQGLPACMQENNPSQKIFHKIAADVARLVALRNANRTPTRILETKI
jgi:ATP-binding protein involved in chromosome partitioning